MYLKPTSLGECLGYLTQYEGKGILIAGGTDLMFKLKSRKIETNALIDTQSVKDFDRIEVDLQKIIIGAGVTHACVASHDWLCRSIPALTRACGSVGSPQIRNVGTLAGNVVNAQPAADAAMALIALGAEAEIVSAAGSKKMLVEDLYSGIGKSRVDPTQEIISSFSLQTPEPGQGNAYGRISPRNALCLPVVNACVWLNSARGTITEARIVIGPVSDRPFRAKQAEESLIDARLDNFESFKAAGVIAAKASNPRSSCLRGCADYRKQLIKVLATRTITDAARAAANSL
jgi:CO/xanthine dehydrogenase FAD-binding subunit